jgi:hypothetical protein
MSGLKKGMRWASGQVCLEQREREDTGEKNEAKSPFRRKTTQRDKQVGGKLRIEADADSLWWWKIENAKAHILSISLNLSSGIDLFF